MTTTIGHLCTHLMQAHPVHLHLPAQLYPPQQLAQHWLLLSVIARPSSLESYPDANTQKYANTTMAPYFDFSEQIFQTIQSPSITPSFSWVKGHQDDATDFDKLPLVSGQLNVEADGYAGTFQAQMTMPNFIKPVLPSCPASPSVTSQYKRALTDSCLIPRYHAYLADRNQWPLCVLADIAWKSLSIAVNLVSRNALVTKYCNHILRTPTVLKKWNYQTHDTCCLCLLPEDTEHLF